MVESNASFLSLSLSAGVENALVWTAMARARTRINLRARCPDRFFMRGGDSAPLAADRERDALVIHGVAEEVGSGVQLAQVRLSPLHLLLHGREQRIVLVFILVLIRWSRKCLGVDG